MVHSLNEKFDEETMANPQSVSKMIVFELFFFAFQTLPHENAFNPIVLLVFFFFHFLFCF